MDELNRERKISEMRLIYILVKYNFIISGSVYRVFSFSVGNNFGQILGDATVVYFVHSSEFRQFPPI